MQEVFAVRASFLEESLCLRSAPFMVQDMPRGGTHVLGHDDGADHASSQGPLLAWRDEVLGHGGVDVEGYRVGAVGYNREESK